jgi:hypothetical protein
VRVAESLQAEAFACGFPIGESAFANLCSSAHSLPLAPHGTSFFLAGRRFGLEAKASAYVASECAELNSINSWRVPFYSAMRCKKSKKQKDKETVAEVFKEMAQPRVAQSARRYKNTNAVVSLYR